MRYFLLTERVMTIAKGVVLIFFATLLAFTAQSVVFAVDQYTIEQTIDEAMQRAWATEKGLKYDPAKRYTLTYKEADGECLRTSNRFVQNFKKLAKQRGFADRYEARIVNEFVFANPKDFAGSIGEGDVGHAWAAVVDKKGNNHFLAEPTAAQIETCDAANFLRNNADIRNLLDDFVEKGFVQLKQENLTRLRLLYEEISGLRLQPISVDELVGFAKKMKGKVNMEKSSFESMAEDFDIDAFYRKHKGFCKNPEGSSSCPNVAEPVCPAEATISAGASEYGNITRSGNLDTILAHLDNATNPKSVAFNPKDAQRMAQRLLKEWEKVGEINVGNAVEFRYRSEKIGARGTAKERLEAMARGDFSGDVALEGEARIIPKERLVCAQACVEPLTSAETARFVNGLKEAKDALKVAQENVANKIYERLLEQKAGEFGRQAAVEFQVELTQLRKAVVSAQVEIDTLTGAAIRNGVTIPNVLLTEIEVEWVVPRRALMLDELLLGAGPVESWPIVSRLFGFSVDFAKEFFFGPYTIAGWVFYEIADWGIEEYNRITEKTVIDSAVAEDKIQIDVHLNSMLNTWKQLRAALQPQSGTAPCGTLSGSTLTTSADLLLHLFTLRGKIQNRLADWGSIVATYEAQNDPSWQKTREQIVNLATNYHSSGPAYSLDNPGVKEEIQRNLAKNWKIYTETARARWFDNEFAKEAAHMKSFLGEDIWKAVFEGDMGPATKIIADAVKAWESACKKKKAVQPPCPPAGAGTCLGDNIAHDPILGTVNCADSGLTTGYDPGTGASIEQRCCAFGPIDQPSESCVWRYSFEQFPNEPPPGLRCYNPASAGTGVPPTAGTKPTAPKTLDATDRITGVPPTPGGSAAITRGGTSLRELFKGALPPANLLSKLLIKAFIFK